MTCFPWGDPFSVQSLHACAHRLSLSLPTHQQSLLARFPSLGLDLGALAPHEGGIAWGDKRLWSQEAWPGSQSLQGADTISKEVTKLYPTHCQI